jgi:hypothetical protein
MVKGYKNCPRCNGKKVVDFEDKIKCLDCKLTFDKKIISLIEDKANILANEENEAILRQILESKNLDDFIDLLKKIDDTSSFCPYCFSKMEKNLRICPSCGVFIKDYAEVKN